MLQTQQRVSALDYNERKWDALRQPYFQISAWLWNFCSAEIKPQAPLQIQNLSGNKIQAKLQGQGQLSNGEAKVERKW